MKRNDIRAGLGEIGNDAIHRFHHQVHVDGHLHVRPYRLADQRADGQIRHVVVVHHVEVDHIRAGGDNVLHFVAKTREIGGQECSVRCEMFMTDYCNCFVTVSPLGRTSRILRNH